MHRVRLFSLVALILAANAALLIGAAPAIGIAISNGPITVDNARAAGNATIFNGNTIETARASSQLQYNNGERVQFASDSRGKVYSDHLILEKGATQFQGPNRYEVSALSLRITGADSNTSARVSLRGPKVQVAALNGAVRVANANGVVIANLAAGRALDFTPQEAGASAPSTMTGCLSRTGGTYTLTDETSNVTAELRGSGLGSHVGHRISVTGTTASGTPAGGASQVVNVSNVNMLGRSCTVGGSSAPASASASGAGAGGGMAGTAVVAGIVIAAAVGTTIGVLATEGESSPVQSVSPGAR